MPPATEHIDPRAKLVDEVVDWLCGHEPSEDRCGYAGRVRTDPFGAKSPPPTNLLLWDDEDLGPCPVPVRLDRPSSPANPWDPHEVNG